MPLTEKNALYRVLMISRAAYSAISNDEVPNPCALLDSLSAALSHAGVEEKPLSPLMGALKREIKAKNKPFYQKTRRYFSRLFPVLDYDYEKALRHVGAIIFGNDAACARISAGEADKARSMCDALKSYPGFLFGEYEALSDEQFYDLVFGYYPKLYGEEFMEPQRALFSDGAR